MKTRPSCPVVLASLGVSLSALIPLPFSDETRDLRERMGTSLFLFCYSSPVKRAT